jgi:dTDP-4-amino-4,6-dideoxy-D-glucose acyltransferase
MAWLTNKQISSMGFAKVGSNALLSDKSSYYNCGKIEICSNVIIDDFCVLSAGSGGILIGRNIHIAVYSLLIARGKIILSDFSNLSSRVSIYSSNDDYTGNTMTKVNFMDRIEMVS